jgi:hypothetical protein
METINDLDLLVSALIENKGAAVRESTPIYHVKTDKDNDMLSWMPKTEIQDLSMGLWRVGAIGDGNCMLHSLLTAMSPRYRRQNKTNRQYIADKLKTVLAARVEELMGIADMVYFNIGGSSGIIDSFDALTRLRHELSLEMGAVIARLYGHNFLAVQLGPDLSIKPACQTLGQYNPELPTVLINYIGGGLNFGNVDFESSGHYEVIFRTNLEGLNVSRPVELNDASTTYTFDAASAADILELFSAACAPKRSSSRRSSRRSSSGRRSTRKSSNKKNGSA